MERTDWWSPNVYYRYKTIRSKSISESHFKCVHLPAIIETDPSRIDYFFENEQNGIVNPLNFKCKDGFLKVISDKGLSTSRRIFGCY